MYSFSINFFLSTATTKYAGTTGLLILIFSLMIVVTCICLLETMPVNVTKSDFYQSNTTAVLHESSRAGEVTVTEDAGHPGDSVHKISVYKLRSKCSKLPTKAVTNTFMGSNNFSLINGTYFYALDGSMVTLDICGRTNQTSINERLEVIFVDKLKVPLSLQMIVEDYKLYSFEYFPSGVDGNQICKVVTFHTIKSGYYATVFSAQPKATTYTYTATIVHHSLNLSQFRSVELNTLDHDKDSHTFSTDSRGTCFIARIEMNLDFSRSYVHIKIMYELPNMWFHVVIAMTVCICFIVLFIVCFIMIYRLRKYRSIYSLRSMQLANMSVVEG